MSLSTELQFFSHTIKRMFEIQFLLLILFDFLCLFLKVCFGHVRLYVFGGIFIDITSSKMIVIGENNVNKWIQIKVDFFLQGFDNGFIHPIRRIPTAVSIKRNLNETYL